MCNLINTHTHTHTVSLIPPWEDQCEWHRMTRMTGPDCAVMCNLINTMPVAPVAQRYHVTSDTLGREFDPGKRDFSH